MRLQVVLCPNLPDFEELDPRAFETQKGSPGLAPCSLSLWINPTRPVGFIYIHLYISHNQGDNHAK